MVDSQIHQEDKVEEEHHDGCQNNHNLFEMDQEIALMINIMYSTSLQSIFSSSSDMS